jgi:hypothetical protein
VQRALTTVTLLGLLVATAAAFVITEHLKQIKSPVYGTQVSKIMSPVCNCATSKASISFRLRHRDHVTVSIVNAGGGTVATIRSNVVVPPKHRVTFLWDGRTDEQAIAADGAYYPEVHLANARRTLRFPNRIVVDTKAPDVLSASAGGHGVFFPGGGRTISIDYALGERAHAAVYLGGRRIILGRATRLHGKVVWTGMLDRAPVEPGRHVLSVGAVDLAGNETPVAARKRVTVVIRYIVVSPARISVRSGKRISVRVDTKAKRYTWRLGHRHGTRQKPLLQLPAPSTPGTYRLVVSEDGHSASTLVRVRAK